MEQKNREMYSLETELKLLRPFVQKSPTYKRRYSEEDILAAEQRLNYKLPAPLKFMYLYMSDLLFVGYYLRPLELLHWDHDHLGIFPPTEWDKIIGIRRNAAPNTLYCWEEEPLKGDNYEIEDEFEACANRGDECGKQRAAQQYLDYWKRMEQDPSFSQTELNSEAYYAPLDEYVLFLSLHALYEDYEGMAQVACHGGDPKYLNLFLGSDLMIFYEEWDELIAKIEKRFRPLSEHTELLVGDIPQLYTAYIHLQEPLLIVVLPGFLDLILLTPNEIAPDVRADLEQSTGLTFCPLYP